MGNIILNMPNLLTGLKYQAPLSEANTEAELLEVFSDLRKTYDRLSSIFRITDHSGTPYNNFRELLEVSAGEDPVSILVNGSGDVGGLVIKDASLEYDLSAISVVTKLWDNCRDGDCHSCKEEVRVVGMDCYWECNTGKGYGRKDCPDHKAIKQNSEGKPARKLIELVAEASK